MEGREKELAHLRPHSEYLPIFFNIKAAVNRMCLVIGPSFSSLETKENSIRIHVKTMPSYLIHPFATYCEISENKVS